MRSRASFTGFWAVTRAFRDDCQRTSPRRRGRGAALREQLLCSGENNEKRGLHVGDLNFPEILMPIMFQLCKGIGWSRSLALLG